MVMKHGRVAVLADPSELTEEDHWRNLWSSKAPDRDPSKFPEVSFP
jgi:hypothetical protein